MRQGVMEYAGKKLKELSAYLGEQNWFAGETVCIIAHDCKAWRVYSVENVYSSMCYSTCTSISVCLDDLCGFLHI